MIRPAIENIHCLQDRREKALDITFCPIVQVILQEVRHRIIVRATGNVGGKGRKYSCALPSGFAQDVLQAVQVKKMND